MEIQTRHRKSAEANRPKGRALFALAERREAPVAALLAALMVGMAAWVKSAFGGTALEVDVDPTRGPERADAIQSMAALADGPVETAPDLAAPDQADAGKEVQAQEAAVADLGRIGRGPAAPDLSRFFQVEEPTIDLPQRAMIGGDGAMARPAIYRPDAMDMEGGVAAVPSGKAGGPVAPDGGKPGGPVGGEATAPDAGEFDGIRFETLFARLAEVARPFHPETVRDIGSVAIGDWISAHELQRLRGNDSRPDAEAAFMARENQTYQLLSNEDTREAFLDRHFPSEGAAAGQALAAADVLPDPAAVAVADTAGALL